MKEPRLEKFDESYFLIDGDEVEEIPRVSNIINPGGIPDFQWKYLERGTRVHRWTEANDRQELALSHLDAIRGTEMERYLQAWVAFKSAHDFVPSAIEAMVWAELGGKRMFGEGWGLFGGKRYAGTIDRIGTYRDKSGQTRSLLLDIKTTSQAKPSMSKKHGMQLAAYAEAWRQRFGSAVDAKWIVYLQPTGGFVVKEYVEDKYLTPFRDALREHYKREEEENALRESSEHGDPVGEDSPSEPAGS